MAYDPAYASTPKAALGRLTTANTSRAQTTSDTNIITVFAAGASGSRIDDIAIIAESTTTAGMIRLWIHDGTNNTLWREYTVGAATPSGTVSPWSLYLANLALCLQTGYSLKASTNNTEVFDVWVTRAGDF
jgi:hypothetical protein